MEKRYTVMQACEMVGVKSYVLRYWEDELDLAINRNELGHRYYTGYDIQIFANIKELKNRGLKLTAIKELIPKMTYSEPDFMADEVKMLEAGAMSEKTPQGEPPKASKEPEIAPKILEFQEILERLIQQELHLQQDGEDKCRMLDSAIRRQQLARREAAATGEKRKKHKIHR